MLLGALDGDLVHVVLHHKAHQLGKAGLGGVPAQLPLCLAGVAPQVDHVGGAVEIGADLHKHPAGGLVDALFVHALAGKFQLDAGIVEGQLAELPHAMLLAGGNDKILRLVVLQDQPHALDIILGVAPVPQAGQVAQIQLVLLALGNAGRRQRDLAGDEGLAPALGLVVEQNAGAGKHAVGFPVLLGDPEAVLLGHRVGAVGVEGGVLVLGHLLHLAEQLGRGGLVDAAGLGQAAQPHRLQDAQHAGGVHVGGVFGHVKADLHVALRRQVVDLVGADAADDRHQAHRVAQIAEMQVEAGVALQMGDALAEIHRRAPDDAVDVVAFLQQKFRQVAAVLAGHAGDQCFFHPIKNVPFYVCYYNSIGFELILDLQDGFTEYYYMILCHFTSSHTHHY